MDTLEEAIHALLQYYTPHIIVMSISKALNLYGSKIIVQKPSWAPQHSKDLHFNPNKQKGPWIQADWKQPAFRSTLTHSLVKHLLLVLVPSWPYLPHHSAIHRCIHGMPFTLSQLLLRPFTANLTQSSAFSARLALQLLQLHLFTPHWALFPSFWV